jgi:hypothetical protein
MWGQSSPPSRRGHSIAPSWSPFPSCSKCEPCEHTPPPENQTSEWPDRSPLCSALGEIGYLGVASHRIRPHSDRPYEEDVMPNGRSCGFVISKTDLAAALTGVSGANAIGAIVHNRTAADVDASEVSGFLQSHLLDVVTVEEQHRDSYIHLGELNTWVSVRSESPRFAELKRRHGQHLADHPGWRVGCLLTWAAPTGKTATHPHGSIPDTNGVFSRDRPYAKPRDSATVSYRQRFHS